MSGKAKGAWGIQIVKQNEETQIQIQIQIQQTRRIRQGKSRRETSNTRYPARIQPAPNAIGL